MESTPRESWGIKISSTFSDAQYYSSEKELPLVMQVQGIGESLVLGECLHLYIKEKTTLVQDYCF